MPCFFAPACASLGFLHAAPLISLRYLQAGKQGRPILGNSWRKGACWHWRPAILRFPTATVCSGLGSPPCIRRACWSGRPASLRICGGKHTEEMAVSVSVSQKNERILQYYDAGMTILGNEAAGACKPGRRVRVRHGKLCMAASLPERGNEPHSGYLLLRGEAFFMLWTTFSRCRNMAS